VGPRRSCELFDLLLCHRTKHQLRITSRQRERTRLHVARVRACRHSPRFNPSALPPLIFERAHFLALPFPLQSGSLATPVALQAISGTLSQVSDL